VVTQYSTSTSVADLTDGAEYRFKVAAENAVGDGAISDGVAIYAATVPNAPAAPTMVSQSGTSITIQWTDNGSSDTGGSPVFDYRIYWDNAAGDGVFTELAETTAPDFTFTTGDVEAGYNYRFKITAINIVGESLKSPEVAIIASSLPG
jgi:hypothetical protein